MPFTPSPECKLVRRVRKNGINDFRIWRDQYKLRAPYPYFIALSEFYYKEGEGWLPRNGRQVTCKMDIGFVREVMLGLAEAVGDDELIDVMERYVYDDVSYRGRRREKFRHKVKTMEDGRELVVALEKVLDDDLSK